MNDMKKLPIGIQSFEKLRDDNYVYVDKTRFVYDLAHSGGNYFFLSRPRRFGKSLLLTTLKAYFEGKRNLFEGLAIMELEHDWKQHPVLHLDLNTGDYTSVEGLWDMFRSHVIRWEKQFGVMPQDESIPARFANIIRSLDDVVILVDEYDKPLLQTMNDTELQDRFRTILKSMYSVLKTCDAHIRFALLTGVSRFSHVSIFSDLNNLTDITLNNAYAAICGITEEELRTAFAEHIADLAATEGVTDADILAELKAMYDGYHFTASMVDVYNPFSLLNAFYSGDVTSYWYQTGTPTFLIKMLEDNKVEIPDLSNGKLMANSLADTDNVGDNWLALFFQTGYLTIKGYNRVLKSYYLGFPNREVEEGFVKSLIPHYTHRNVGQMSSFIQGAYDTLMGGDPEGFLLQMQSFLAGVPYELVRPNENWYQTVVYLLCRLLGFYTQAEYHTSRGRVDMVLQTPNYIYVFEFKIDLPAVVGARQIEEHDYALPFASDPRKLFRVAVSFNTEKRNIDEWQINTENQC
jgi:hypothetical protein